MKPPDRLKAAVLSAATRDASPTRSAVDRRRALSSLVAGLWVLSGFAMLGGMRAVERPLAFVLETAAGWAGVALLATWGSWRGRSMLGRPRSALWFMVVATPLALEAWYFCFLGALGATAPASPAPCGVATLAMAMIPCVLFLRGRKGSDPTHAHATGAAIGVVCGAWIAVLIDLHCEHGDLAHVTIGHVLPVVLMALAGAALGGTWLSVRGEAR